MCIITASRGVCRCPLEKNSQESINAAGGVDCISSLHSSITAHILSRLPTEEAVRTSVLSKNWKFNWRSIYNIKISDIVPCRVPDWQWEFPLTRIYEFINVRGRLLNGKSTASLTDMMERISLSHHVTSFTLFLWDNKYDLGHLTKWISAVLGSKIDTFKLTYVHQGLVLPQTLLKCTSLRNLELKLQCTFRVPSVVHCFPNLVKLSLHSVEILNEDSSMDTLILKFKVLETLELYLCKWLNVKFVEIQAPALTTFKYNVKNHVMCKAIGQLDRGLALPRYDRLERLDIHSSGALEGLLVLLHVMPFLKILEIDVACWRNNNFDAVEKVPSCIISSLEEVKFRNYYYMDHKFELEKLLLGNAKQLRKITLEFDLVRGMPRDEFVKQLKAFPRASSTSLDIIVNVV